MFHSADSGCSLPRTSPLAPLDVVSSPGTGSARRAEIRCSAEIRYTQQEYGQKLIRAGARFIDLDKGIERTLLRAIYCLEREQIRKRPPAP
jgi:c-di-GMP-binding flagellar brake protein YcgR